jgi:hypothetical protein
MLVPSNKVLGNFSKGAFTLGVRDSILGVRDSRVESP